MRRWTEQKGIALIQVLLITGILTVLVLYLSQTARSQVELAQLARDRATAEVAMHGAFNKLTYQLLTRETSVNNSTLTEHTEQTERPISPLQWNFNGKPFEVESNTIALVQDQAGLLSLHFLDCSRVTKVLVANLISQEQAEQSCNALLDWQDRDFISRYSIDESAYYQVPMRNGLIPDLTELEKVPLVTPEVYAILRASLTVHDVGWFNPVAAPELVLKGFYAAHEVEAVKQQRLLEQVDSQRFRQITGAREQEGIWFRTSSVIGVTLKSIRGEVELSKTWILHIKPYGRNNPISILESRT